MSGRESARSARALIPINVLVAAGDSALRQTIRASLEPHEDIEVVAEARTSVEGLSMLLDDELVVDIVVLEVDASEKQGPEAVRRIKERLPHAKVVLLAEEEFDGQRIAEWIRAGVSGIVLAVAALSELFRAVRVAHRGRVYIDQGITRSWIERLRRREASRAARGETTSSSIPPQTVSRMLDAILEKLGASNRPEANRGGSPPGLME